MNILIPDSWLRDYIKTEASPQVIGEKLSLSSMSVEKINRVDNDSVYEIENTPNRSDTLSVLGMAREVFAVLPQSDIKVEFKEIEEVNEISTARGKKDLLEVEILKPELCPRFTAVTMEIDEIKPSPRYIQKRLEMSGVRSLNNIVDISNYIMLGIGQPMHIFDFDKLGDKADSLFGGHSIINDNNTKNKSVKQMILRESRKGEKIETLDGVTRDLPNGSIVIESGGKLIDLCGIMGGKNSAVDENTKRILLFVQTYDPYRIRKTSQALALRTEAALRFEKGIDPLGIMPAMNKAVGMVKELASGRIISSLVDIQNETWEPHTTELEIPKVERYLGVRIPTESIIELLKSLGFEVRHKDTAIGIPTLSITVPSYRSKDVTIPEDIIEEIARLYGYYNIPDIPPAGEIPTSAREKVFAWEDKIKNYLKYQNFFEVCNYSFVSKTMLEQAGVEASDAVKVKNPLNADLAYLKPSHIITLLSNLSENQPQKNELRFFEYERVYRNRKDDEMPQENFRLTGIVSSKEDEEKLFYKTKGVVEGLLNELGIGESEFESNGDVFNVRAKNRKIGTIRLINPRIRRAFSIEQSIAEFDFDAEVLLDLASNVKRFTPIPEYPPVIENLSVIVGENIKVSEMVSIIKEQSPKEITITPNVEGIYRGESIADEKKSVTFKINYQSLEKTLGDEEIKNIRETIIKTLEENFSGLVRKA